MPDYKIEAHSTAPVPHTITTPDKARAIRYAAALAAMGEYYRVTVTVGGKVYSGEDIRGKMP